MRAAWEPVSATINSRHRISFLFVPNFILNHNFCSRLIIRGYYTPLISEALPRYYNQGITKESPIIAM
ncbi:hypothetical protein HanPI659440_Chr06g0219161 [Helianthus annuus]|nr:hypothetical protein HanPI659440_Chr06g0219161 [Helianthus annuus]